MKLDFACPWCGADTTLRGASQAAWRFRLLCDLCTREMVVTWDGRLDVSRVAAQPLEHSSEVTQRFAVGGRR